MFVAIRVGHPLRAWHLRLAETLETAGHLIAIQPVDGGATTPMAAAFVLAAERRLYGRHAALFVPVAAPPPRSPVGADLAVVLAGAAGACELMPLFDGAAGEAALFDALLRGRAPLVSIATGDGITRATGLPAVEEPDRLSSSLDGVLARVVTLLVQAVMAPGEGPPPVIEPVPAAGRRPSALAFLCRAIAGKIRHRFGAAHGRPEHWRIGYRLRGADATARTRTWPQASFDMLADDGTRFYADPFPLDHGGGHVVLFEDFPYATGKGVIGAVSIGADGLASTPRTVFEGETHVSYPFLIRDGSDIFMLPETSQARRVQLFRADPFPDRWVPDAILLHDVMVSDPTIVVHAGRFWLFGTLSRGAESTWDQLGLFHAPSLRGPWTAHPSNPVLIDAGAARPAGGMWHEDGRLMRVAQDCRTGYGAGLVICRVDRLDETGFAQTVVARLGPPDGAAEGVHTLNAAGGLEVVDVRVPHMRRRG